VVSSATLLTQPMIAVAVVGAVSMPGVMEVVTFVVLQHLWVAGG
jgi:hypothetical protein